MGYRSACVILMAGVSAAAIAVPVAAQTAPASQASAADTTAPAAAVAGGNQTVATPAPAVSTAPLAAASPEGEVIVTGSRIARSTFQTPTPVTAISEKQLQQKAATTVTDLLADIPALRPNQTQGGGRSIGVSNFNMRSLGASRTLVLLDGQRLMDSSPVGGFDLNVIPAALISRLEIVTAGASSVYGSDAVTGVVNVIIDGKFTGGKIDAQYDISGHGDQKTTSLSGAFGAKFGSDDRGHIVIAASYLDRPNILYQGERGWGSNGTTLLPNAAYTATNGQFRQVIVDNAKLSNMTPGGLITTGPLKGIEFGANGAQSMFQYGSNVGSVWMQGGEGALYQPDYGPLIPSIKQTSLFGRLSYDIGSNTEFHLDLLGTNSKAHSTNNFNYNSGDIKVSIDNAYLPANIKAAMIANNLTSITMGRLNPELGLNDNYSINHYYRTGAGLKGKLFGDWTWDVESSYTYGLAANYGHNNRINANWTKALDSVIGPNGTPICRSTLTNPNNGCAPANIFGLNTLSQAVVDYVTGTSFQRAHSRSFDANANIAGDLGRTWAGPIKLAFGGEWRRNSTNNVADPISDVNGWRQGTFASFKGKVSVKEGYGEASIPLARDAPLMKSVDLDLAGRYVDYSTSGSTAVWKAGLNWAVDRQIRFRGTYSKDFRAPGLYDLFSASSLNAGNTVIDFKNNKSANVNLLTGGNRNLKPEVAHTLTGGVVLQPNFAPRLQFSADYFNIKLQDALYTPTAQEVVNRCGAGDATFCAGITRDPSTGLITQVSATEFNAQSVKTSGIDFEASYVIPLGAGDLGLRAVATYTAHLEASTGAGVVDTAGQLQGTFATPKWRGTGTVSYDRGPFDIRALFTLVGSGNYDNTYGPLDISRNHYPAYVYMDLSAEYQLTKHFQIYAKVENLFDTAPPLIASNTITIAPASSSQFYDLRGRFFGVGARYRF